MHDNIIAELLDLQEVKISEVRNESSLVEIYIENKVKSHECPKCKNITRSIHDYRMQRIKDVSIMLKLVILVLRKRRYVCKQ